VTSWNRHDIRLVLLEVAELCRCRKMFAVQSHERLRREVVEVAVPRTVTPGSRRSSRSHERLRREVDERSRSGSEQSRQDASQKPNCPRPVQDLQRAEVPEALLSL